MIICELYTDNKEVTLKMNGHAGYAAEGSDIVCSAASILCYTFATCIGCIPDINVKKSFMKKGRADIRAEAVGDEISEYMKNLINFTSVGFGLLETAYPKNVKFKKS